MTRPLAVDFSSGLMLVTLATAVADTLATVDAAEAALEVVDEAQGHLEAAVVVTLEWTRSIAGLPLALSVERGPLKVVTVISTTNRVTGRICRMILLQPPTLELWMRVCHRH